jgi:hypothetical protein
MRDEGTLQERFLEELYRLTEGEATKVVRGEEFARRLGIDPLLTELSRFTGEEWEQEDDITLVAQERSEEL